ncbi:hypothetical protein MMC06_000525 [Schaereria dolodes]|nr:hypothetical protein [Schaereria dolodes]
MASNVLSARDVNTSAPIPAFSEKPASKPAAGMDSGDGKQGVGEGEGEGETKSMEYHRQVLQSRMANDGAKPQSLFAKTSSKNLSFAEKDSKAGSLGEDTNAAGEEKSVGA